MCVDHLPDHLGWHADELARIGWRQREPFADIVDEQGVPRLCHRAHGSVCGDDLGRPVLLLLRCPSGVGITETLGNAVAELR
jgi:hypothetical protein